MGIDYFSKFRDSKLIGWLKARDALIKPPISNVKYVLGLNLIIQKNIVHRLYNTYV